VTDEERAARWRSLALRFKAERDEARAQLGYALKRFERLLRFGGPGVAPERPMPAVELASPPAGTVGRSVNQGVRSTDGRPPDPPWCATCGLDIVRTGKRPGCRCEP
jgi:hypothetical protein